MWQDERQAALSEQEGWVIGAVEIIWEAVTAHRPTGEHSTPHEEGWGVAGQMEAQINFPFINTHYYLAFVDIRWGAKWIYQVISCGDLVIRY